MSPVDGATILTLNRVLLAWKTRSPQARLPGLAIRRLVAGAVNNAIPALAVGRRWRCRKRSKVKYDGMVNKRIEDSQLGEDCRGGDLGEVVGASQRVDSLFLCPTLRHWRAAGGLKSWMRALGAYYAAKKSDNTTQFGDFSLYLLKGKRNR